jgi:hypothetical protein
MDMGAKGTGEQELQKCKLKFIVRIYRVGKIQEINVRKNTEIGQERKVDNTVKEITILHKGRDGNIMYIR